MKTEKYNVTGMTCAACQANVTRCVSKLEGVEEVNVSLLANQMTVSYDERQGGRGGHHPGGGKNRLRRFLPGAAASHRPEQGRVPQRVAGSPGPGHE